ncbi:MAG: hypothetical protein IJM15_08655 [Erysipelotrichaceae bacterium]|nr:hypothetical protein [Erysipelotrichaceae bacterium]
MVKVSQIKTPITPVGRFFPAMMPNGHWAEEIADEQYASIMLLEVDGERVLWVSLDAIGMTEDFSRDIRQRLSGKLGIPFDNTNIGCTHSHCAPRLGANKNYYSDEAYFSLVADRIIDGAERCLKQGLSEVEVYERNYDATGYYSNRNGLDKTGDMGIKLLDLRDAFGVTKGMILIYACHSTVVNFQNSRSINSDLGGYLCRGLEDRFGVYPLVMLGASGDMSNRCTRQGNTYDELIRVGEGLLARFDMKTDETKLNLQKITTDTYQYLKTFVTTREERQLQIANIRKQIAEAPTPDLRRVFGSALEHAEREPDGGSFTMDVKGSIYRLGDLEIVTMPAELFSCFGLQIKAAMPVKCPVFWGYSNYSVGYLYNKEEAGKSFESAATNIPAGVPEEISKHVCSKVI